MSKQLKKCIQECIDKHTKTVDSIKPIKLEPEKKKP